MTIIERLPARTPFRSACAAGVLLLFAATLAACSGGGASPGAGIIPGGPQGGAPTAAATAPPSPASGPTTFGLVPGSIGTPLPSPVPTSTATFPLIGAMDGSTCVYRGNGEVLWPGEDLCVTFAQQVGQWSNAISPAAPSEPVSPMNVNPDTIQLQFNRTSGTTYTVTFPLLNIEGVQKGGQYSITIHTPTVAQQAAAQAVPLHHVSGYFGSLVHDDPAPFGMLESLNPPYPIDQAKLNLYISQGMQIARIEITPWYVNPSSGVYDFGIFDPVIDALQAAGIQVYVGIRAGPVRGWANGNSTQTNPLYANPNDYAGFCSAVASHLATKYPQITKVAIPTNEPNFQYNWPNQAGASMSGNPAYNDYTGAGEAIYMKPCYAAIKAVAPKLQVFAADIAFGGQIDAIPFLQNLYKNGCRMGVCFDGLSLHLSPYNDMTYPTAQCFYWGAGWTGRCYKDAQAVVQSYGDPIPPVILSETGYSSAASIPQGFDEAGQAYLMSKEFATLEADPTVAGVYWSYIDSDGTPPDTYFGEFRTVHDDDSPKLSFSVFRAFATR
jgi:hypothetical protein